MKSLTNLLDSDTGKSEIIRIGDYLNDIGPNGQNNHIQLESIPLNIKYGQQYPTMDNRFDVLSPSRLSDRNSPVKHANSQRVRYATPEAETAPRRDEVDDQNHLIEEILEAQGFPKDSGIKIVVGNFEGRTPIKVFLSGLAKRNFVVPKSPWDFNGGNDHDEVVHFNRLAHIHPKTAEAVATYAQTANELIEGKRIEEAIKMANKLDFFLSSLGHLEDNILREIAFSHFCRHYPDRTIDRFDEYVDVLTVAQSRFSDEAEIMIMEKRIGRYINFLTRQKKLAFNFVLGLKPLR